MSEEKLASNEVPLKFSIWLLAMGCPPENVPSVDKIAEICRGQYYMVWRSLMEKVEAKDVTRNKRLQVFCDDMKKCQKKNVLESDSNAIVPEELLLWNRHAQLKEKVADAEAKLTSEKETLHQLTDYATSKLSQRNLLRKSLEDTQCRAYFLQRLSEQLAEKKANLLETRSIAESLCGHDEEADVESKLNKCVSSLACASVSSKSSASLTSSSNPAACSTAASNNNDHNDDEIISCVARCRGEVLFKQLYEQRARLCTLIPATQCDTTHCTNKVKTVLCHTAALQSFLSLEAMKNRLHNERIREKLARTFLQVKSHLSFEEIELLLSRCERACSEARVASLRACRQEIISRSGVFATGAQSRDKPAPISSFQSIDKTIESKRDELRKLITSVAAIERKTQNAKERLLVLFNGFHDNSKSGDVFGGRSSCPQESIATLRQFYEEKREKYRNKVELSMNLDVSDNCSFNELNDGTPKFINELKLYLSKFSLENNRTLVLESGEKIWIFESIESSLRDIRRKWETEDMSTSLLCPTLTLKNNLYKIEEDLARKEEMQVQVQALEGWKMNGRDIDITNAIEEEQSTVDKIKKLLNDNILNLQKTSKTLDIGMENLQFWADNSIKKYISDKRKINGVSYSSYEKAYLDSLM